MLAEMTRCLLLTACALAFAVMVAAARGTTGPRPPQPAQRPPVVIEVRRDGFHWGDAAIGAAATLGLVLAAGGVHALRRSAVVTNPRRERNL